MKRLKNNSCTIYDAQIVIYYCFLIKNHRIVELTNKARRLTRFLVKNNIKIVVPESVIVEIKNKGFEEIIDEYTYLKCPIKIIGLSKSPTKGFKYYLEKRLEKNFNDMIKSSWFEVRKYSPRKAFMNLIEYFFENIEDESQLREFLTRKNRDNPVPSRTDMELIAFSKDIKTPLVSNDKDITFFADELFKRNLSYRIYSFLELDFYG